MELVKMGIYVPVDIRNKILKMQEQMREETGFKVSQGQTISFFVEEYYKNLED